MKQGRKRRRKGRGRKGDRKKKGKREREREKRGKEGGNKASRQEGRWEKDKQIEYSQFSLFSCLEPFLPTRVLILVPYFCSLNNQPLTGTCPEYLT